MAEVAVRHAGVIAQQIEQVVPECVRTLDSGLKGVEYSHLSMMMLKHVQVLSATVQQLTNRVATLEAAAAHPADFRRPA